MMGTYTYTRSYKILMGLICGLFFTMALTGEILFFFVPTRIEESVFLSLLYIPTIIGCGYAINNLFSSISIDTKGITNKSLLYKRTRLWEDVEQVKFTDNGFKLCTSDGRFPFHVSYYRNGYHDILAFVAQRYHLEIPQEKPVTPPTPAAPEIEITEEHIRRKVEQADKFGGTLVKIAAMIGGLMLITGYRIIGLDYLQFLLIPVSVYGFIHFRSILHIRDGYFTYAFITMLFVGISMVLCPGRKHIFLNSNFWITAVLVFGILTTLFFICMLATPIPFKSKALTTLLFSTTLFLSSCGIVNYTNIAFDNTAPVRYQTTLINKKSGSTGRSSYLEMTLKGWLPGQQLVTLNVEWSLYRKFEVNQEMAIEMWPGRLGIPWYHIIGE